MISQMEGHPIRQLSLTKNLHSTLFSCVLPELYKSIYPLLEPPSGPLSTLHRSTDTTPSASAATQTTRHTPAFTRCVLAHINFPTPACWGGCVWELSPLGQGYRGFIASLRRGLGRPATVFPSVTTTANFNVFRSSAQTSQPYARAIIRVIFAVFGWYRRRTGIHGRQPSVRPSVRPASFLGGVWGRLHAAGGALI